MKSTTFLNIAILSLALLGCAQQPQWQTTNESRQLVKIELWHKCVENNLQYMNRTAGNASPEDSIQHTLIACRGHREDVLATFPLRMEQSLDNLMVRQTYETGYTSFAKEKGMSLPINSLTFDTLKRQHAKP